MPPCPVSHRRLYFQWGKRTGDGKRVCWLWVNCLCIISLIKMFTCYFALFKAKIIGKFTKEKKMPLISSLLQVQVFREPKSSFFSQKCELSWRSWQSFWWLPSSGSQFLMIPHFNCLTSLETPTCQLLLSIPMLAPEGFHLLRFYNSKSP